MGIILYVTSGSSDKLPLLNWNIIIQTVQPSHFRGHCPASRTDVDRSRFQKLGKISRQYHEFRGKGLSIPCVLWEVVVKLYMDDMIELYNYSAG